MPIGVSPIGSQPIGSYLPWVTGNAVFQIKATSVIGEKDSLTGVARIGAITAASTIYTASQLSARIRLIPKAAGSISQTNVGSAAPRVGSFKVSNNFFAGAALRGAAIIPGLIAVIDASLVNAINAAPATGAMRALASLQAVNGATAAPKLRGLQALSYEINNGSVAGHPAFGPLKASGLMFFGALFLPPRNPQWPLDLSTSPRMLQPGFTTGDPVFEPDGINFMLRTITLKFSVLTQAEFSSIDAFISANLSNQIFYTLPDEATPSLWTIVGRTRRAQATTWEYQVALKELPVL